MSYNWTSASTPQGRERLKELMDSGFTVVGRSIDGMHDDECYFIDPEYDIAGDESLEYLQFLDPSPSQPKDENGLPTDDEISFVASDESNHHEWMDLGFRNTYQQGFEDGAKWMRNKKTT